MRMIQILIVLAPLAWTPASALANGLLYKLPADGFSALYDMTIAMKKPKMSATGTLMLSSVGKATSGGKECRWIEFTWDISVMGRKQTIIVKALIPEEDLGAGKNPLKNPQKGWMKETGRKAKTIKNLTNFDSSPIPLFLAGPLRNAGKLKARVIDTKVGKLKCAGESGRQNFQQGKSSFDVNVETRLHPKSPFGVAYSKMVLIVTEDGKGEGIVSAEMEFTFTLKSVGKNAKSKLPDQK